MDNQFFICIHFNGIILTTTVGCIFECRQQITMRFNRNVSFDDIKELISAKIVRRCVRRILKLFYKFSVSMDPIKFTEMEFVDDEDMETIITLYCGNRSGQNAPIQLFAELASVEPTEYLIASREEHGAQEPCMVTPLLIDPDAAHVAELLEYLKILSAHRLAIDYDSEKLFIGLRLATLIPRIGQQQVNQMEAGHVFFEDVRDAMVANCRMARLTGHSQSKCPRQNYHIGQSSRLGRN
ncbi:hypothetical protein GOBAR_DD09028 [Gossypium barbadense]|nr:hypothetical protein GOBAR_DD09028 [Gossypium barbadense]